MSKNLEIVLEISVIKFDESQKNPKKLSNPTQVFRDPKNHQKKESQENQMRGKKRMAVIKECSQMDAKKRWVMGGDYMISGRYIGHFDGFEDILF